MGFPERPDAAVQGNHLIQPKNGFQARSALVSVPADLDRSSSHLFSQPCGSSHVPPGTCIGPKNWSPVP